jgi:hypothetical protein
MFLYYIYIHIYIHTYIHTYIHMAGRRGMQGFGFTTRVREKDAPKQATSASERDLLQCQKRPTTVQA